MKNFHLFVLFSFVLMIGLCAGKKDNIHHTVLWEKGSGKYNNYRIPSLIVTQKGTVLAFCEGREDGDAGNIDLLLKRSEDGGKTWGEEQVIWDDKENTCGNPCPVVDKKTGRIWLFSTWNNGEDNETKIVQRTSSSPRLPYLFYSDDDGKTWSTPVNMTESCRDTAWGWYATGPGIGIQIEKGKYKGRLVFRQTIVTMIRQGLSGTGFLATGHMFYILTTMEKPGRKARRSNPAATKASLPNCPTETC